MPDLLTKREPFAPADPTVTEPRIWIERIKFREENGDQSTLIREVNFKRGVNIITTKAPPPEVQEIAGHSVGKTILLRSLRYCLGENHFARSDVRTAIGSDFNQLFVYANVWVNGSRWAVRRLMSNRRSRIRDLAMPDIGIDELEDSDSSRAGFNRYLSKLKEAANLDKYPIKIGRQQRSPTWPDILGWLARDQEARFRSYVSWRDPDSEAEDHILGAADCCLLMRSAMSLLGERELKLQTKHRSMLRNQKRDENALEIAKQNVQVLTQMLSKHISQTSEASDFPLLPADALSIKDLQVATRQELEDLKQPTAHEALHQAGVDQARQQLIDDRVEFGVRQQDLETKLTTVQSAEADDRTVRLKTLGQLSNEYCHLFDTEQEAIDRGCPGPSSVSANNSEVASRRKRQIEDLKNQIEILETEISESEIKIGIASSDLTALENALTRIRDLRAAARARLERRLGRLNEVARSVYALRHHEQETERLENDIGARSTKIKQSLDAQTKARSEVEQNRLKLAQDFDQIVKRLVGLKIDGNIRLHADAIVPMLSDSLSTRGLAMGTSTQVLGFDLACLLAHIHGLGHLPGLWIHDSPREADMEDALYARFFNVLQEIGDLFLDREPSFQYIVATTTRPPSSMKDLIRLELDALEANDQGLLLKRSLQ